MNIYKGPESLDDQCDEGRGRRRRLVVRVGSSVLSVLSAAAVLSGCDVGPLGAIKREDEARMAKMAKETALDQYYDIVRSETAKAKPDDTRTDCGPAVSPTDTKFLEDAAWESLMALVPQKMSYLQAHSPAQTMAITKGAETLQKTDPAEVGGVSYRVCPNPDLTGPAAQTSTIIDGEFVAYDAHGNVIPIYVVGVAPSTDPTNPE